MKRTLLIFLILIQTFGQLAAQTFEKTIPLSSSDYVINGMVNNSEKGIDLVTTNYLSRPDSLRSDNQSTYFSLDSIGSVIANHILWPSDLDSSLIDSINHLDIQTLYFHQDTTYMYGRLRTSIPGGFTYIKTRVSDATGFEMVKHFSETKDSSEYLYSINRSDGIDYNSGVIRPISAAYSFGYIQIIDDSSRMKEYIMFNDQAGYWLDFISDLLIDNEGNIFTFSGGYSPPPFYSGQGLQIHKFDSNLNLIRKKNCSIPARHAFEDQILFNGDYNAVWLNDSSFLIATAISNNIDTAKGDVHLIVYDTSLTRLAYKRIVTTDTNLNSFTNSLVYDRVSKAIYFGVTQGLHEFTGGNIFRKGLPSSFRLFKMDKDLNIIWDRSYYNKATIRLEHVVTDTRGNITMAGTYEDSATRANNYERHLYILRVDSMGNFNPIGIVERDKIPSRNYLLYPNPLEDKLIARRFNQQSDYQLRFFDPNGRLIKERSWTEDQIEINTTSWPGGLIIYQLEDQEGRKAGGKLIKR